MATIITAAQVTPGGGGGGGGGCTQTVNGDSNTLQTAINAASDGDTICLNAGTFDWTTPITCTKGVTIQGAGQGSTTILDKLSGTGLTVSVPAGKAFRLTALTFTASQATGSGNGLIQAGGGSTAFRLDHLTFGGFSSSARNCVVFVDNVFGVADHITWNGGFGEFLDVQHTSYQGVGTFGDNSWAQPTGFGSANFFFVEDSTFFNASGVLQSLIEGNGGAGRLVVRHNTFTDYAVGGHGTETPGRNRGMRAREVYANTFTASQATDRWVQIRSGTGLIYGNVADMHNHDLNNFIKFFIVRLTDKLSPWGHGDDTGPYDSNSGTIYDSGTATSGTTTNLLNDTTKTWTPVNKWAGFVLRDTTNDISSFIASSTATSVTTYDRTDTGLPVHNFAVGDSYQIRQPLVLIDQPGRGAGVLLSGATPSPTGWVNDALEPVRIWSNTSINPGGFSLVGSQPGFLVAGTDYLASTDASAALPGYTAYTYPHPLNV